MTLLEGAEDFVTRLREKLGETRFLLIEDAITETLREMGKESLPEGNGCPYCFGYGMEQACFACGRVRKTLEVKPVNADYLSGSIIVDVDDSEEEETWADSGSD
jgi:hypothetical protein